MVLVSHSEVSYFAEPSRPGDAVPTIKVNDVSNAIWYDSDGSDQKRIEVSSSILSEGHEDEDDYFQRIVNC